MIIYFQYFLDRLKMKVPMKAIIEEVQGSALSIMDPAALFDRVAAHTIGKSVKVDGRHHKGDSKSWVVAARD